MNTIERCQNAIGKAKRKVILAKLRLELAWLGVRMWRLKKEMQLLEWIGAKRQRYKILAESYGFQEGDND